MSKLTTALAAAGMMLALAVSGAGATGVPAATEAKQSPLAPYIHLAAESSCTIKCEKQAQKCRVDCGTLGASCRTGCGSKGDACKAACK